MSTIFYRSETGQERSSPRRRVIAFALALAIEVALLLALLTLDFRPDRKPQFKGGTIVTFSVANEQKAKAASSPARQQPAPTRPGYTLRDGRTLGPG